MTVSFIHSFTHSAACLMTGTKLFPKQVLKECDLVLPLAMFTILSFLKIIQCLLTSSSSSSCNFYPSFYLTFSNVFYETVPTPDVTNPDSLPLFVVYMEFFSSLTVRNTYFTRSAN